MWLNPITGFVFKTAENIVGQVNVHVPPKKCFCCIKKHLFYLHQTTILLLHNYSGYEEN